MELQDETLQPAAGDENPYRSPRTAGKAAPPAAEPAADRPDVVADYPAWGAWDGLNELRQAWFVSRGENRIDVVPRKSPVYVCIVMGAVVILSWIAFFVIARVPPTFLSLLWILVPLGILGVVGVAVYLHADYVKGPWLEADGSAQVIELPRLQQTVRRCDCVRWDLVSGWWSHQGTLMFVAQLCLVARTRGGQEEPLPVVASGSFRQVRNLCEELSALTGLPMRKLKLKRRKWFS